MRRFLLVIFVLLIYRQACSGELLNDSFESKDMSTTNASGFYWDENNRTSIVTMNPECGSLSPGTPTAVYNNAVICNGPQVPAGGGDWYAKTGNYSLRFRYQAGEAWAEQRFSLGRNYPEVWFSYWIRVPVNFTYPSSGLNNKWFAVWTGASGYDKHGDVTWQLRGNGSGANIVYQDGGVLAGEAGSTSFISVPGDRGRWMHVVIQVVASSSAVANNGVIRLYRRWDEDANYALIHEKLNANTYNPDEAMQGISHGYIMGWANSAYEQDTEWLVDDFTVSTTTLLVSESVTILPFRTCNESGCHPTRAPQ